MDYSQELLTIIRNNENPEQALKTAISIITSFLEQPLSFQKSSSDFLQELD